MFTEHCSDDIQEPQNNLSSLKKKKKNRKAHPIPDYFFFEYLFENVIHSYSDIGNSRLQYSNPVLQY